MDRLRLTLMDEGPEPIPSPSHQSDRQLKIICQSDGLRPRLEGPSYYAAAGQFLLFDRDLSML